MSGREFERTHPVEDQSVAPGGEDLIGFGDVRREVGIRNDAFERHAN